MSVEEQHGLLIIHTPVSIVSLVVALVLGFASIVLLAGLTDNPFRVAQVRRAVGSYLLKLLALTLVAVGFVLSVQLNDLILDARSRTAKEVNRYLFFYKNETTYDLFSIQRAEVYGSRNGGADRLSLVFADGHVHSLTGNNMKFGKGAAAVAINNYLIAAR